MENTTDIIVKKNKRIVELLNELKVEEEKLSIAYELLQQIDAYELWKVGNGASEMENEIRKVLELLEK